MTYLVFSPLEQFEFITIGLIPEFSLTKFQCINWLINVDYSIMIQELFSANYNNNINNASTIIVEGITNINLLEILEYLKNYQTMIDQYTNSTLIRSDYLDYLYQELEYPVKNAYITRETLTSFFNDGEYSTFTLYWLNIYNSAMIVFVAFILCFIYFNIIGNNVKFFNIWNYLIDLFFSFLLQTFMSLADRRLLNYFPIFSVFFIVIFLSNLTALVPLSFCLTSNLWLTLTLSFSVWVGVSVLAIIVRGFGFFLGFIPSNVPAALKGFITVIEIISYLARAISLGVRIFANMLAGHSLVHILSDLVETCIISFNHISLKIFGIFPALILTFILFIEFGICFLQALVFVILTAIYLKEAFGFSSH